MRHIAGGFSALALTVVAAGALAQAPPPPCGETVKVERGDTLSRIADRCDVSERSLVRLNPRIEGSRDLRAGMEIRVRDSSGAEGADVLDRLGALAGEAADAVSGLARDVGSSAQDLLERNPDLRQRLESFGQRLGGTSRPAVKGSVSVTPKDAAVGDTLTVSAEGLPRDTPVLVGAGRPQAAYEVLERARTTPDGALRATIRIPDWAAEAERIVVVVAGEEGSGWTVRSAPVQIAGQKL